jgi:hypothetical protein
VPALVGAHALLGRPPGRGAGWRLGAAALVALVVAGAWTNLALGIEQQRERGKIVPDEWRAQLVRWRSDLPGRRPPVVTVSPGAPILPDADDGTLAVVGDCLGLYVRVGDTWRAVDRGPGAGVFDIRVDLDALATLPPGERAPLATFGDGPDASVIAAARLADGDVRLDVATPRSGGWDRGSPHSLRGDETIRVVIDPRAVGRYVLAGRTVLHDAWISDLGAEPLIGALPAGIEPPGVVDRYPGAVELLPFDRSLCRAAAGIG